MLSGALAGGAIMITPVVQAAEIFDLRAIELRDGQQASDLETFNRGGQLPGTYLVDIYVNGELFAERENEFILAADGKTLVPRLQVADLKAMGIKVSTLPALARLQDTDEITDLAGVIPNATVRLEYSRLRLNISVPQIAINQQARNAVDPGLWDEGMPALLLNYAASGSRQSRQGQSLDSNYLRLSSGANLGAWRLRNNSSYSHSSMASGSAGRWQSESTWLQRDLQILKGQLRLGETNSDGQIFDSIPFRGAQLVSDDGMLPDSQRGFAPVVRGIARSDAQITIRQNGYIIYQDYVAPGAFAITDLYPTASSGNLDVTIREADGSERSFVQPFSAVRVMQREGALKYDFTVGEYRSFYDAATTPGFLQSSAIYGVNNMLTLYAGTQLAGNYRAYLAGIGQGLGEWGSLSLDLTQANSTLRDGTAHSGQSLRMQYAKDLFQSGTTFTLAGYRYSTAGFYDFRETNEIGADDDESGDRYNKRSELSLQLSQTLGDAGSLYVTGLQRDYWQRTGDERSLLVGYNGMMGMASWGLTWSLTRMPAGRQEQQIAFNVQLPLSQWLPSSWAGYQMTADRNGRTSHELSVNGAALKNNTLSYSVAQSYASQGTGSGGRASANFRGQYGTVNGAYRYGRDEQAINYGLSGALVAHPYGITLSQPLGESAVLVRAPGARGAEVQNQSGVKTDWRGYAVVPWVNAYRKNRVALDPSSLPDDVDMDLSSKNVVPTRGALVLAEFQTRVGARALLSLTFRGKPVPFGTTVVLQQQPGKPNTGLVGPGGEVYLSGLPEQGTVLAQWGKRPDEQCIARFSLPAEGHDNGSSVRTVSAICQ